jgi:hypothetical protein
VRRSLAHSIGAHPLRVLRLRAQKWRTRRRASTIGTVASPTASCCASRGEGRGRRGEAEIARERPEFLAGVRGFFTVEERKQRREVGFRNRTPLPDLFK